MHFSILGDFCFSRCFCMHLAFISNEWFNPNIRVFIAFTVRLMFLIAFSREIFTIEHKHTRLPPYHTGTPPVNVWQWLNGLIAFQMYVEEKKWIIEMNGARNHENNTKYAAYIIICFMSDEWMLISFLVVPIYMRIHGCNYLAECMQLWNVYGSLNE